MHALSRHRPHYGKPGESEELWRAGRRGRLAGASGRSLPLCRDLRPAPTTPPRPASYENLRGCSAAHLVQRWRMRSTRSTLHASTLPHKRRRSYGAAGASVPRRRRRLQQYLPPRPEAGVGSRRNEERPEPRHEIAIVLLRRREGRARPALSEMAGLEQPCMWVCGHSWAVAQWWASPARTSGFSGQGRTRHYWRQDESGADALRTASLGTRREASPHMPHRLDTGQIQHDQKAGANRNLIQLARIGVIPTDACRMPHQGNQGSEKNMNQSQIAFTLPAAFTT